MATRSLIVGKKLRLHFGLIDLALPLVVFAIFRVFRVRVRSYSLIAKLCSPRAEKILAIIKHPPRFRPQVSPPKCPPPSAPKYPPSPGRNVPGDT